jgi:hypothetical protein
MCIPPIVARQRLVKCITPFVAMQRLGKHVPASTNACKNRRIEGLRHRGLRCLWVSLCISLSLLGKNSVNMFPLQWRMVGGVVSKASRRLFLPRTSCLMFARPFKPLFIQSIQLRQKRIACDSLAVVHHVTKEGTAQRFPLHEWWLSYLPSVLKLIKKVIEEPWFPGLTLKTVLNWDFYWNKYTFYIKIQSLLKHYYMYSQGRRVQGCGGSIASLLCQFSISKKYFILQNINQSKNIYYI